MVQLRTAASIPLPAISKLAFLSNCFTFFFALAHRSFLKLEKRDFVLVHLLHIHCSPKGERSSSLRLARAFLDELQTVAPDTDVHTINLFTEELAEFGADASIAKFAPILGETTTPNQDRAWAQVLSEIKRFDRADKILLSTPMWNYSVPYKLKHYLDIIMQPRVTFGYNPKTMEHFGMLRNRPAQFILTRSSVFPGDFRDFQLPYLKFAFDCMGIRDTSVLAAWRTTQATAEQREQYLADHETEARQAARAFAVRGSV